jgi:DNA-binding winged helix-turn-helix (wHTH) protein/tetratricopeptide (TPR) repeat protein
LYEFDKFRADPSRGVLLLEGEPVTLTAKTFELLLVLIRHRNETVSKDTLLTAVWPGTFVEEANLVQHISMLRKALGESPQERRFIATVPGRGYRFVADVREVDAHDSKDTPAIGVRTSSGLVVAESNTEAPSTPSSRRRGAKSWIAVLVLMALGGGTYWILGRPHLAASTTLGEKDSILLSDFENSTGESVFDGTLKEAMAVELGQSPYLDLVSDQRVQETLQFMAHSPGERIRLPLAKEVCERVGSKALILGSISRLGSAYVVSLEAQSCADAAPLAREQFEARNKEEVLPLLGKTTSSLRRKLGESLKSIQTFDVPLEQATTPSLEALKVYSLGVDERAKGAEKNAIPFFQRALELDPKFAMAYAQLGAVYRNLGETEQASDQFKRAFALQANLSEREKLHLTVRYHETVTGDTEKATETYEIWSRMYPRDPLPFNGLSARYQVIGQYEKAAAAALAALNLAPNYYVSYANLARSYLALNRLDEARDVCRQATAAKRDSLATHRVLFNIAFLNRDQAAMQHELDWAKGTEHENDMLVGQAFALTSSGRLAEARELFERSWKASLQGGLNEDAAYSMAGEAITEADFGFLQQAQTRAEAALRLGHGIDAEEAASEALALAGNLERANFLVDELRQRFPRHAALNNAALTSTLATIALHKKKALLAIEVLQAAQPYDLSEFAGLSPLYIRGQAYLNAGMGKEAAAQFQKIIDHPGIDATDPRNVLAHLGLARALAKEGDIAGSRSHYQEFLTSWSHADADIPILRQAKLEYERLR